VDDPDQQIAIEPPQVEVDRGELVGEGALGEVVDPGVKQRGGGGVGIGPDKRLPLNLPRSMVARCTMALPTD